MHADAPDPRPWPPLPVAQWQATRDTLHLWTQVVGKVRLARTPLSNHWWNSTLYVTARGLTTSLVPYAPGRGFQMDFDFLDHRLVTLTTAGDTRSVDLAPRPVADFYSDVVHCLDDLGLPTRIWPVPVEIEGAIPFPDDRVHASYDAAQAQRFWRVLVEADRVFSQFRGRFVGKVSPVHFFWGALDLAVTRFSGRPAPPYPGSAPNCGPHVMREAYSHEVSSAGYWPGGEDEGVFYSYAYPEPDGFREFPVAPAGAYYNEELGEFVLPYREVRTAEDPDGTLLEFLQSTYEAAAALAHWDRAALEHAGA
ncbi:DUF5996 family protein [Streptomyces sp. NPDC059506]|uniref:DUF5996 family protein n=1 Tax=unclassified Streptomyces TaxID=2593676 RepID=UPI000CB3C331|nr:DUF5996 family protein [Streptomyces sp. SCUT-3]PLW73289.1 hypothetical protein C0036_08045 [Streptomyces sp. DJ]QMV23661.1 hypothetical protein GQS52_19900 [Streptomyces sp. SCUT-3]